MDDSTEDKQHYAEEVALLFEQFGMTRMAGRILGWLLVCEPPYQSLNELAEALQASKGSISTMTRFLIERGVVERFTLPGERRDYFRIRPDAWTGIMAERVEQMALIRQMAERGLEVLSGAPRESRQRLEDLSDLYAFLEREVPLLIKRWQWEREEQ